MEHDCVIREANRESVFTLSVDAHIEIGRMQMRNETGWVAWGCNGYGCVCLKKQRYTTKMGERRLLRESFM